MTLKGVCKCGREMTWEEFQAHGLGLRCEYNPRAVKATFKKKAERIGLK